jgi:hypothetical protein
MHESVLTLSLLVSALCCPIHRVNRARARGASDLKLGFCQEACKHSLKCGHVCSLPCHWPSNAHKQKCAVQLESPCVKHAGPISCHHLLANAPGAKDVLAGMSAFRCPQKVQATLPCAHVIRLACWEHEKMAERAIPWPDCNLPSPVTYAFQKCDHTLPVTCRELQDFTANPSKAICQVDDEYHPPCGHAKRMKCWQKTEYEGGGLRYECEKKQDAVLPRCGHEHSVPCKVAQALRAWTGQSCDEVGKVIQGTLYGPKDFTCLKQVVMVRSCGHEQRLACNDAFRRLDSLRPCAEPVTTFHPVCGHTCTVACRFMSAIDNTHIPTPQAELHEGSIQNLSQLPLGVPECLTEVILVRKCGHKEAMKCWSKLQQVSFATLDVKDC